MIRTRIVRALLQPRLISTGTTQSLYLAGGGSIAPYWFGGLFYKAGLEGVPRFKASIGWNENGWTGGIVPTTATLRWAPSTVADFKLYANSYAWKDASIVVEVGNEGHDGSPPTVWTTLLVGTIADVAAGEGFLAFTIADLSAKLDKPMLSARFAGTGGLEGPAEAANRVKRRTFGAAFNIECRILDKANSIWEWGDPAFASTSVSAVRDIGRAAAPAPTVLAWQGSIAATFAALQASSPVQGSGVVAPSIQCLKWWTTPVGPLTVDVVGEAGALSAPQLASAILSAFSSYGVAPDAASLATATAARPDPAGLHIGEDDLTLANALDKLLLGVSLVWDAGADGLVRFLPITFSAPVEAVASEGAIRKKIYPPQKTRRVGYQRNERQHNDGEIAASVLAGDISGTVDFLTQVGGPERPAPNAGTTLAPLVWLGAPASGRVQGNRVTGLVYDTYNVFYGRDRFPNHCQLRLRVTNTGFSSLAGLSYGPLPTLNGNPNGLGHAAIYFQGATIYGCYVANLGYHVINRPIDFDAVYSVVVDNDQVRFFEDDILISGPWSCSTYGLQNKTWFFRGQMLGPAELLDISLAPATDNYLDNVADGATYARLPVATSVGTGTARRALVDLSQGHTNKTVDYLGDGTTYGRPLLARLDAGRPKVDFAEAIHSNKTVDNVGDGTTYARLPVANSTGAGAARRALVDFAQGHTNKTIDNVGDGATYARPLASRVSAGKPLIDFSEGIHLNKTVDYIGDGATYGRALAARLNAGKPWVDFAEAIHANQTVDYFSDGATYARLPVANSVGSGAARRALVDFSQGHTNKTVDHVGDGATYGRPLLSRLSAGKPLIDFAEAIHTNKNVDNIGDGATYARLPLATSTGSGTARRALVDFTQAHTNKNVDNVADGATYARILGAELTAGAHKLGIAGSGKKVGDSRNLPNITSANLQYKFTGSITYTATSSGTATISVSAGSVLAGAQVDYSAMSVGVSGYTAGAVVNFWLYVDDTANAGGAQTLYATTTANTIYQFSGRVYIGVVPVTFPVSGSGGGGGYGGGGGGGGGGPYP